MAGKSRDMGGPVRLHGEGIFIAHDGHTFEGPLTDALVERLERPNGPAIGLYRNYRALGLSIQQAYINVQSTKLGDPLPFSVQAEGE